MCDDSCAITPPLSLEYHEAKIQMLSVFSWNPALGMPRYVEIQISLFLKVRLKGELWCKNKDFSKERPTIIASNFPIPVALSYKLESNSAIEVDLKCD